MFAKAPLASLRKFMNTKNIRKIASVATAGLVLSALMPLVAMAATPSISSISPAVVVVGSTAFTMNVYGSNFDSNATVYVNGMARLTNYVSSAQLTASMLATDLDEVSAFNITVNNPSAGGGTSNALAFAVVSVNPFPVLTTISPASVVAGSGNFILTVQGSNFNTSSSVRFNGMARATTFVSPTQLTALIPASDVAISGSHLVYVVNPTPGGGTSNWLLFTVSPVAITPGLPNTGFGPAESDMVQLAAIGAILAGIALAAVASRRTWFVKG